ncbi:MAG TPA: iron transporter [Casimicrobiaceae bacterium]|jgi:uncharacterized protein involved in high-affinity Fe2+ transport|nr:iron transporter [Casimicrobiaceae bacterium]
MTPLAIRIAATAGALALAVAGSAFAIEYPIGKPQHHEGLEVSVVYLQPVTMEPAGMMREARASDVHLEADVKALSDNKQGFAEGVFVPYLVLHYEIRKSGSNEVLRGDLMPMVASDGPHYGDNVKLLGPGRYQLSVSVAPPDAHSHFGRHVDKETGVAAWFAPFKLDYDFTYAGVGKKGSY